MAPARTNSAALVVARFEVVPTEINKGAIKDNFTIGKLADIILEYKLPANEKKMTYTYTSKFDYFPFNDLDKNYHFSAAVAMFGSMLRTSPFIKNIGWNEIITLAQSSCGSNDLLQKEFVSLVQQAKILYSKTKKKKGGGTSW
jgi:Ca-activated chloride channel family protein